MIFFFSAIVYSQDSSAINKLRNVVSSIDSSVRNLPQKVVWNFYPADSLKVLWYEVFFVAGDDSSKFPFWLGSKYDDVNFGFTVSDWKAGETFQNSGYFTNRNHKKFWRVGIIGKTNEGVRTKMFFCKTFENKK